MVVVRRAVDDEDGIFGVREKNQTQDLAEVDPFVFSTYERT